MDEPCSDVVKKQKARGEKNPENRLEIGKIGVPLQRQ